MDEYRRPYLLLWAGITDALKEMRAMNFGLAEQLLMEAQRSAEEEWINEAEEAEE